MKLYEYQAKELFARVGIPTPRGQVAAGPQAAAEVASNLGRAVVKAQVHAGGRGKAGLIQVVDEPVKAEKAAESMIGRSFKGYAIRRVLVEEALDIQKEYYASVVVDRSAKAPLIMVSAMGGVDIEDVALRSPEAIARLHVDPSHGLWPFQARNLVADAGLDPAHRRAAADIIVRLYRLFLDADASLVEINPLVVLGDGRMLAADAKLEIDDNAVYRHPEVAEYKEEAEEDPLEAEAHRRGLAYVRLDGDVGVIGNGAGLVMNTLDLVARAGGRPANFLDIGGGARSDVVRQALEVV
ncbi:MAG TPA: ADP-forming succinate--CoA ligase subunit beta, partial [Chloroflexota bacterium]